MKPGPLKKIGTWIRRWWYNYSLSNPVSETIPLPEPEVPMINDVESLYEVIEYHGQRINLHRLTEKPKFEKMNREQKRKVRERWKRMEKKGEIKFIEVNDKLICVQNRDYEQRAERKKERELRHE